MFNQEILNLLMTISRVQKRKKDMKLIEPI